MASPSRDVFFSAVPRPLRPDALAQPPYAPPYFLHG